MMEPEVERMARLMSETIRNSRVYRRYERSVEVLKAEPGIFERIMELRNRTIDVYHDPESRDLDANTDVLSPMLEELQKKPEVRSFLEAEEDLIRLLQDVNRDLFFSLDLVVPKD